MKAIKVLRVIDSSLEFDERVLNTCLSKHNEWNRHSMHTMMTRTGVVFTKQNSELGHALSGICNQKNKSNKPNTFYILEK